MIALLPLNMMVIYLGPIGYFRAKGGRRPAAMTEDEGACPGAAERRAMIET